jgi:hypothetical protein
VASYVTGAQEGDEIEKRRTSFDYSHILDPALKVFEADENLIKKFLS